MSVRAHERVSLFLPCRVVHNGEQFSAAMCDLSERGCKLSSTVFFSKSAELFLSFALPDGQRIDGLVARVRHVERLGEKAFHGCCFEEGDVEKLAYIRAFVADALARRDIAGHSPERRVLD